VAGRRRGTRRGGRHRRASASACGGQLLQWWHSRSTRWLADDATTAQGGEAVVERDGE
jgi:hypothetical protein